MFVKVQLSNDSGIASIVETRFASQMSDFQEQGFVADGLLEVTFSLPLLPVAIVAGVVGREVWKWDSPFRVKWYHPVMRSQDGTSVAYPFGMGVRYYTFFDDGSAQRTSACKPLETKQYKGRCKLFIANLRERSIGASWLRHLAIVEQHTKEGKHPLRTDHANRLVTMQTAEDSRFSVAMMCVLGWCGVLKAVLVVQELVQG